MFKKFIIVLLFLVGLGSIYTFTANALGLPSPAELIDDLTS